MSLTVSQLDLELGNTGFPYSVCPDGHRQLGKIRARSLLLPAEVVAVDSYTTRRILMS